MSNSRAGRKPKPTRLKVIEGNPGKRAIPEGVQAPPAAPDEPDWKGVFPGTRKGIGEVRQDARDEWRRIVPVLDGLGLLSTIDNSLLTDYCVCWSRLLECEREVATKGLTLIGERGARKNPAIEAAGQYRQQLRFYIGELGLSPSSRGRLQLPQIEGPDDDLD